MKSYQIFAVLVLCALSLTSAYETDHSDRGRRPHGSGGPGGPPDARPGYTCHREVNKCSEGLINTFYRPNINDSIATVHQAGFTKVCQDIDSAISCAQQGLQLPDCESLPASVKGYIQEFFALGEYVCEDRGEDVSKYWDCLLSPNFINRAITCPERAPRPKHDCHHGAFEDLAECVGIMARSAEGSCDRDSDVGVVAHDIMMKLIYFGKKC